MNTQHHAFWQGALNVMQPARGHGYRFNLDSVLLYGFAPDLPHGRAIDFGAGIGIISLLLLRSKKIGFVTAVERQADLAALLQHNIEANALSQSMQAVCDDIRTAPLPVADLVIFNPPYFAQHASRPATHPGRDAARRECHGTLTDFVARAADVMRPGGQLAAIVPYKRAKALFAALTAHAFGIVRMRAVIPYAGHPPRQMMVHACKAAESASAREAALVVHETGGAYTAEVTRLLSCPPDAKAQAPSHG